MNLTELKKKSAADLIAIAPVSYTHLDVYKRQGFHQMMQSSQQKSGCFTGAGLGLASDILAFKRQRQGSSLNRRTMDEASIRQAFQQRFA